MRNKRAFILFISIVASLFLFLFGCAAPWAEEKPKAQEQSQKEQIMIPEATETPPLVVEEKTEPPERFVYQTRTERVTGKDPFSEETTKPGWRIQVYMTEDPVVADTLKNALSDKYNIPAYVVFETPYYRVRIGDFSTKDEANELLKKLESKGFAPFLVQDDIEVKKNR